MEQQDLLTYRSAFGEYLSNTIRFRRADDNKIKSQIEYVEANTHKVICSCSREKHDCVYEYLDKQELNDILDSMLQGGKLASLYESTDGFAYDSLQMYIGFLDSNSHPLSEKQKKKRKKRQKPVATVTTTATPQPTSSPESAIPEPKEYDKMEGAKHQESVVRYERDRGNRKACVAHYGYVCQVCGMDFAKAYGELGKEYIEVHHLHPVSQGERKVNPIEDLIPLCANCHSMIHRQEDVSDWKGLREKYLFFKAHNNNDTK